MDEMINFTDVRLFYTKTGTAKYISHLDVMRAFQRALKRSKIDFWYTEGFHPHLYLTFALPLSLGYESMVESVDFRLVNLLPYEEIVNRINAVLPMGFEAISAGKPKMDAKQIRYADYKISFLANDDQNAVKKAWCDCFLRKSVLVTKKTKHGESELDLKPHISLSELQEKEGLFCFSARLAAGVELTINPELLFSAFREYSGMELEDISVTRTAVYNKNMEKFC